MRELMRSIARSRMKDNGIRHINKKLNQIGKDGKPYKKKMVLEDVYVAAEKRPGVIHNEK